MKVKVIARKTANQTRKLKDDIYRQPRNLSPLQHPFETAREYTRALNATKIERLFAKPFIGALSGHADGVYCLARHPTQLTCVLSGSADGDLRVWNLTSKTTVWNKIGHKGFVKGICVTKDGDGFISVGDDKCVRLWDLDYENKNWLDSAVESEPRAVYTAGEALSAVDHHFSQHLFATSSSVVNIWDIDRSEPIQQFEWGADTVSTVKFNRTETDILASCGNNRTIILYDLRSNSPIQKVIMEMRVNAISWNPMEAFNFVAGSEDYNSYYFDMRNLSQALHVYKDHTSAVMDVDFAPTGEEFVTGGYDRSIRIFNVKHGHSREIYHTKRMQRVFAVNYSLDSQYVLSASDDANIRIWKTEASQKLGQLDSRERSTIEYRQTLKERFKHMPEVRRIDRHRHVPKQIYKAQKTMDIQTKSQKRKLENERKHSKPGSVPYRKERRKHIVTTES